MIVSHAHRFIFFAVPKTATQSIRQALAPCLSGDDWQQHARFEQILLPVRALADIGHGHISAAEAQAHLPEVIFDDYFKFAFSRHPVDRFLSACHFLFRDDADFSRDPISVMKTALSRERFRQRILIRPQSELLCLKGEIAMDFVGRYENLESDFHELNRRLGLAAGGLARINASVEQKSEPDDELQAMLDHFYRSDYELLGYGV